MTGKSYKKLRYALASILTATICWGCMFHPQHCYAITHDIEYQLKHQVNEAKYSIKSLQTEIQYNYKLDSYDKQNMLSLSNTSLEYLDELNETISNLNYSEPDQFSDFKDDSEASISQETYDNDPEWSNDTSNPLAWIGAIGFISIVVVIILLFLALVIGFLAGYFVRGKVDDNKRRKEQETLLYSDRKKNAPKTEEPVKLKEAAAEEEVQTIEKAAQDEISQRETVQDDNEETQTPIIKETNEAPQNEAKQEATMLFAGLPRNGIFCDVIGVNTGKAFYFIKAVGATGEFSFISNETTLRYAKSSTTEFIECACDIVETTDSDYYNVTTLEKGKIEKVENGWKIIEKAQVCLG